VPQWIGSFPRTLAEQWKRERVRGKAIYDRSFVARSARYDEGDTEDLIQDLAQALEEVRHYPAHNI